MPMDTVKANRLMPSVILVDGEDVAGQSHGSRSAYRVHDSHIEANHNQESKYWKRNKCGKRQTKQSQKEQIYVIAVEIIQQVARHRPEQNRRYRHSSEHNTYL